jgi:putative ABC transport system permease protein
VTNIIIDQQVAAIEEVGQTTTGCPLTVAINSSIVREEPLSNLNVLLNGNTIMQLVIISLLLSSLSGIISTAKITKYEPIKILMERD